MDAETLQIPGAKNLSPGKVNRIVQERHAASHKVIKMLPPDFILNKALAINVLQAIK